MNFDRRVLEHLFGHRPLAPICRLERVVKLVTQVAPAHHLEAQLPAVLPHDVELLCVRVGVEDRGTHPNVEGRVEPGHVEVAMEDFANLLVREQWLQEPAHVVLELQRVEYQGATPARQLHHAYLAIVALDVDSQDRLVTTAHQIEPQLFHVVAGLLRVRDPVVGSAEGRGLEPDVLRDVVVVFTRVSSLLLRGGGDRVGGSPESRAASDRTKSGRTLRRRWGRPR